ncbi:MAG: outer membrane beta-barrel protein [Gemmatimonadaceae bacterium]|nr:outer membrane beta-barrel protein [Gemmatimonadaceae bacterium]
MGLSSVSAAQTAPATNSGFAKGTKLVSLGVIAGGDDGGTGAAAQMEWGVASLGKATLSLGAFAGIQRKTSQVRALEVTASAVPVLAVANLHFPLGNQPRLDLYGGASFGFVRASAESTESSLGSVKESETRAAVGIQVGGRYKIASRLSLMGQVGLVDLPLIQAGVSIRL